MSCTVPPGVTYLGHLGKGGQGVVSKVQRDSDGKILAMKKIEMAQLSDWERADVGKELKMHRTLKHRYIIDVVRHYYDWENDFQYIFMELCSGRDLDKLIQDQIQKNEYLPEGKIWKILAQIVIAVHVSHHSGILHRDIKPEKIFLTEDMEVCLGDYGLSVNLREKQVVTDFAGTPEYAAPEALNQTPQGKLADCYSIGAVAFEMANLRHLVSGPREGDAIRERVKAGLDTSIPSHYSPQLADLVKDLLSYNPCERPSTTELLSMPSIRWGMEQVNTEDAKSNLTAKTQDLSIAQKTLLATQERLARAQAEIRELETRILQIQRANDARSKALDHREQRLNQREARILSQPPIRDASMNVDCQPRIKRLLEQDVFSDDRFCAMKRSKGDFVVAADMMTQICGVPGEVFQPKVKKPAATSYVASATDSADFSGHTAATLKSGLRRVNRLLNLHDLASSASPVKRSSEDAAKVLCLSTLTGDKCQEERLRLGVFSPTAKKRANTTFSIDEDRHTAGKITADCAVEFLASPFIATKTKGSYLSPDKSFGFLQQATAYRAGAPAFHLPTAARYATNAVDLRRF